MYLASASNADAAYKIYLKNGSVISGVSRYKKAGGELKIYFEDSMIGIPESDVLKIEKTAEPERSIKFQEGTATEGEGAVETEKPAEPPAGAVTDSRKQQDERELEIAKKEEELKKVEEELQTTRLRVEAMDVGTPDDLGVVGLQQKANELQATISSLEAQIANPSIPAEQKAILSAQLSAARQQLSIVTQQLGLKSSLLQPNMFKRKQLEAEKQRLEEEIRALKEQQ